MSIAYAVFMGILQGLTEFLPVSSSGHLVIVQHILGVEEVGLSFSIILHLGTLVAVIIYYRRDIMMLSQEFFRLIGELAVRKGKIDMRANPHRVLLIMVIVATFPTAVIGFVFNNIFESLFQTVELIGYALIITGILIWFSNYIPAGKKQAIDIKFADALKIGIVQGAAIIPGISRSGSTIFAGLSTGFSRDLATRFSFLMSIPAIIGATVLEGGDMLRDFSNFSDPLPILLGFLASAVSGYLAIDILIGLIKRQKLQYFSYYCWTVGGLTILYLWLA